MPKITLYQTPSFKKVFKKLYAKQQAEVKAAIRTLLQNPQSGELKKGDLRFLRVYKFKMSGQLTLLGYAYEEEKLVLELLALGTHENFYRDLKR
ncbi:MAG: type II toxin-antitoxin system RelE/ParE family toxin [Hydrogenovibrio sp.]|uniref:type II toxin-antitoxin system RelE/ParE family toxin n=1 Tax=Hydrogenovibrio sp. TaxID=2065821 RepID=UPI0028705836|nr:type II toxin-antitoxin system RelE/ParE family toxin [Hydrogenovibrio sp.]MDR9498182.1 type II toxin-antitoxin system RelE/ParE family toxin [Hydrogenovibrio sp.]